MRDQLDKQIYPNQDAGWRQERCVIAKSDIAKHMRRHPIELRAGDGFGSLEESGEVTLIRPKCMC